MKKTILALLFLSLALTLCPLENKDFDKIIDFSLDLRGIHKIIQDPSFSPAGKRSVVFDGTVTGVLVMNPDPHEFTAELEVSGGEWAGPEEVLLFRVFVYAFGLEFSQRIDGENPDIRRAARILVAGTIHSVYTDETDGRKYAIIFAHHIRTLK